MCSRRDAHPTHDTATHQRCYWQRATSQRSTPAKSRPRKHTQTHTHRAQASLPLLSLRRAGVHGRARSHAAPTLRQDTRWGSERVRRQRATATATATVGDTCALHPAVGTTAAAAPQTRRDGAHSHVQVPSDTHARTCSAARRCCAGGRAAAACGMRSHENEVTPCAVCACDARRGISQLGAERPASHTRQ